jgi:ankyrin repeat protein
MKKQEVNSVDQEMEQDSVSQAYAASLNIDLILQKRLKHVIAWKEKQVQLEQMVKAQEKLKKELEVAVAQLEGKQTDLKGKGTQKDFEENYKKLEPFLKKRKELEDKFASNKERIEELREQILKSNKQFDFAGTPQTENMIPKIMDIFFEAYSQYLASLPASSASVQGNNFSIFFDSLSTETQQIIMADCYEDESLSNYIERTRREKLPPVYNFKNYEVNVYVDSFEDLPSESGQEKIVPLFDIVTLASAKKKVAKQGKQYFIKDEYSQDPQLVRVGPINKHLKYNIPGNEALLKALERQFTERSYTPEQAVLKRDCDYLVKNCFKDLLSWNPKFLLELTYKNQTGYGTILHKAIDSQSGVKKDDFLKLYNRIYSFLKPNEKMWYSYASLPNEMGFTIFDLAKSYAVTLPQKSLPEHLRTYALDTHTRTVHMTIDQAVIRLAKKMDYDLGVGAVEGASNEFDSSRFTQDPKELAFTSPAKQAEFSTKLDAYFDKLKSRIDELASKSDDELFEYISPSLDKFEQEQGSKCQAVGTLKLQLFKIQNMLNDIVIDKKLSRPGSDYPIAANKSTHLKFTPKEILALAYYSVRDETSLVESSLDFATKNKFKVSAELSFLNGLYDARRGYNIDAGNDDPALPDNNRCLGGTINSVIGSLHGVHKLVAMVQVDEQVVCNKLRKSISEYLQDASKRARFDQTSYLLNLVLWRQNSTMPSGLLRQFNEKFKEEIITKTLSEYGRFLGDTPEKQKEKIESLYNKTIATVTISKELNQEIAGFDIPGIATDVLYNSLINNELQGFLLTKHGYEPVLDMLLYNARDKFKSILKRAAKEERLMDLIDNKFNNLCYCRPSTIKMFLERFSLQKSKAIHDVIDQEGRTALTSFVQNSMNDMLSILQGYPGFQPNKQDKDGGAMHWAIAGNCISFLQKLKDVADINANLPNAEGFTPVAVAIRNQNIEAIKILRNFRNFNPTLLDKSIYTMLNLEILYKKHGDSGVLKDFPKVDYDIPIFSPDNAYLLKWMVVNNDLVAAEALKRFKNFNPNIKDERGMTLFIRAVRYMDYKAIALCNALGVDPNIPDNDGNTPLHWAVSMNKVEVIKAMKGTPNLDPNLINKHKFTPLYIAIEQDNEEVIAALSGLKNFDPNFCVEGFLAPLALAVMLGKKKALAALMKIPGINVNLQDQRGDTALMVAAKNNKIEEMKQFIKLAKEQGLTIDMNLEDNDGDTIMSWAEKNHAVEVIEALKDLPIALSTEISSSRADGVSHNSKKPKVKRKNKEEVEQAQELSSSSSSAEGDTIELHKRAKKVEQSKEAASTSSELYATKHPSRKRKGAGKEEAEPHSERVKKGRNPVTRSGSSWTEKERQRKAESEQSR